MLVLKIETDSQWWYLNVKSMPKQWKLTSVEWNVEKLTKSSKCTNIFNRLTSLKRLNMSTPIIDAIEKMLSIKRICSSLCLMYDAIFFFPLPSYCCIQLTPISMKVSKRGTIINRFWWPSVFEFCRVSHGQMRMARAQAHARINSSLWNNFENSIACYC